MTIQTAHDRLAELAAAYALGALAAQERAEFEAHLAECHECAAEVRSFGSAINALAYAVPPASPSPAVRGRLLARLGSPRSRVAASESSWWLAAASLLLAIGVGVYAIRQRNQLAGLEQQLRDTAVRAETAEQQLVASRSAVNEAQTVVVVLAASDLMRVELAGQPVAPQASARAFWSRTRGMVFTASNLPQLPAGRTYQLWIVTSTRPFGAGLLKPRGDGGVNVVYATPSEVDKPVAFAVTIEPDGGVPAPTGDKYLVGMVN